MGSKPQHAIPSNRPESGGADKDGLKEQSGLLERSKEQFALSEERKRQRLGDQPGADETAADAPNVHG